MARLRIAFFTNAFPQSSEPFIELQASELVRRGHDVTVFGLGGVPVTTSSSPQAVRDRLEARFHNVAVPASMPHRLGAAMAATARTLRKASLGKLPLVRPLVFRRTWLDLSAVFHGELVAGQGPFDILHCQFATLGEHVLKLTRAGLVRGAMVVHFRGYDITEVVQSQGHRVYDELWAKVPGFVANCENFRQRAITIGCPESRIDVVGSGIDLANFPYRPPKLLDERAIKLLAVGRLSPRKGFHSLIAAVALLIKSGLKIELVIVGEGSERDRLEQMIRSHNLTAKIKLAGRLPHSAIRQLLDESHIFVAPSHTCPLGGADAPLNTIKEAMAVGIPVCATRHGGIPELVEEAITGTLAAEDNPADLAAAIRRLVDLSPVWASIAETARKRVETDYDISAVTDRLLTVYRSAIARATLERKAI